ncbi:MAG: response regulator transcription factor [Ignavibacteriaceae bacterium]|nr:response regulator transcription factor [Ignavibacteriaceae bacterium]
MSKILVVEDEPNMRKGLADNLEFEGYTVETASDGQEGYEKIMANAYNLIVMDVMMPKMSGFDVCKKIRQEGIKTPVILLTAKGEEIDKVLGLELGADDYVTKPFSLRELLARIRAVLRRGETKVEQQIKETIEIGSLEVNFSNYSGFIDGKPVTMSHKEFEILKYLWEHKNHTVSRDDLLSNIWGYEEFPTTRTVDNFIVKLRQKVEEDSNKPKIIITVHGIGYKLISAE